MIGVGTIVRRTTSNGVVGPYLYVLQTYGRKDLLRVIGTTEMRMLQEHYHNEKDRSVMVGLRSFFETKKTKRLISMPRIQIPSHIYQRVYDEKTLDIIHSGTSAWVKMYKNKPELVQLKNFSTGDFMIFSVDDVIKMPGRAGEIRLRLNNRLL